MTFIDTDILNDSYIEKLFGNSVSSSLLIIANSLLIGFFLYYCFRLIFSHFSYVEIEKPHQFIFKLLIFGICINFSFFICKQILLINNLISGSICSVGKNIFGSEISFNSLIIRLNSVITIEENSFNIFSIDGLIKGFISIGLFNLIFSYSLRYIMIKVFILVSPFAFLTLINHSTSWFFKAWFRSFISLLLLQSFISFILIIIFSIDFNSSNIFYKILYVGGIYALTKSNSFMHELFGGISTEISTHFNSFRSMMKF